MTDYSNLDDNALRNECRKLSDQYAVAIDQIDELKAKMECVAQTFEMMQEYAPEVRCDLLAKGYRDAISKMPSLK